MTEPQLAIGIDLGATKIAAALVTRGGDVLAEARTWTQPKDGPGAVLERIAGLVREMRSHAPQARFAGIGIGSPGYINPDRGIVQNAVNLGWRSVAVVEPLRHLLGDDLPVRIDNDANVQAVGEHIFGAAQGVDNFVYISVGSGLGCGVFVQGRVVTGATFAAAELGHLVIDPEGRECACGLHGCVETVVSGPGVVATARDLLQRTGSPSVLRTLPDLTTAAIQNAAQQGDELALAVFAEAARWLGIACAACVAVLNPSLIVIGGGTGLSAYSLLVPGAEAELRRRVAAESRAQLRFAPSRLASSAVGAACLVWHGQENRAQERNNA